MPNQWVDANQRRKDLCRRVYQRDRQDPAYTCPKCNRPIDWTLPYKDPDTNTVNIWSKSVDHAHELQDGGPLLDIDNAYTAHLTCNSSKGAARRWARQRETNYIVVSIDAATL